MDSETFENSGLANKRIPAMSAEDIGSAIVEIQIR